MVETKNPTPRAYILGSELREARNAAGLTQRALGEQLDLSHSVLVRWERGERVPSTESVSAMCGVLGLPSGERDRLVEMAREALSGPANSVSVGHKGEVDQLSTLLEYERNATTITDVSPVVVPGLMQTAEYARAIMNAGTGDDKADKRVTLRLGRRDVITRRRGAARYRAFLLESVLHQQIGGHEVMADQLRFLHELRERDNVEIRVIPLSAGWTPAHASPFVLLEFTRAAPVVHLEHHRSSAFLSDPGDVKAFEEARKNIEQVAMTPQDTAELIAKVADQLEMTT